MGREEQKAVVVVVEPNARKRVWVNLACLTVTVAASELRRRSVRNPHTEIFYFDGKQETALTRPADGWSISVGVQGKSEDQNRMHARQSSTRRNLKKPVDVGAKERELVDCRQQRDRKH